MARANTSQERALVQLEQLHFFVPSAMVNINLEANRAALAAA